MLPVTLLHGIFLVPFKNPVDKGVGVFEVLSLVVRMRGVSTQSDRSQLTWASSRCCCAHPQRALPYLCCCCPAVTRKLSWLARRSSSLQLLLPGSFGQHHPDMHRRAWLQFLIFEAPALVGDFFWCLVARSSALSRDEHFWMLLLLAELGW